MLDYQAFSLNSNGRLNVIKTECGVSLPFDPVSLKGAQPPAIHQFVGLWDTGASGTVITKNVVDKLGLTPTGKTKVFHANGESIVNTYLINIYFINQVGFTSVRVSEGTLTGMDVLIGMDIISQGDFSISNFEGKTTFSFRVPSVQKTDFVEDHKKHNPHKYPILHTKKVGRNEPCPCGSNKKYKFCHGKK